MATSSYDRGSREQDLLAASLMQEIDEIENLLSQFHIRPEDWRFSRPERYLELLHEKKLMLRLIEAHHHR